MFLYGIPSALNVPCSVQHIKYQISDQACQRVLEANYSTYQEALLACVRQGLQLVSVETH